MLVLHIEVFMKYVVEMASHGMVYVSNFMKIGTGV
jgi:hypothetical protein